MKTVAKVEATMASPAAATANHASEPVTKPAMKAGAPRVPRASTRAISAVTPGPGMTMTARYAAAKTSNPVRSMAYFVLRPW